MSPRAMPASFFDAPGRAEQAGMREGDLVAFCTCRFEVRRWMEEPVAFVFGRVPVLGGVLTITASKNLTSCASQHRQVNCPRCASRSAAEIIAEVKAAIAAGARRAAHSADFIV